MEVEAITRNVRMSAQKMREVVRQIQGLPAPQAAAVLKAVPRKSARAVMKTLESALANAAHLKTEWTAGELRQKVDDLQRRLSSSRNRKLQIKLNRRIDRYEGFLNSKGLNPESLHVKIATAGTATSWKRMTPKARGSSGPIIKRNCHIKIVLSDE